LTDIEVDVLERGDLCGLAFIEDLPHTLGLDGG
jgi:hypothetical protein